MKPYEKCMAQILAECGVTDFDADVIDLMVDFCNQYMKLVMTQARENCQSAGKNEITPQDIRAVTLMRDQQRSTSPVSRANIAEIASRRNKMFFPLRKPDGKLHLPRKPSLHHKSYDSCAKEEINLESVLSPHHLVQRSRQRALFSHIFPENTKRCEHFLRSFNKRTEGFIFPTAGFPENTLESAVSYEQAVRAKVTEHISSGFEFSDSTLTDKKRPSPEEVDSELSGMLLFPETQPSFRGLFTHDTCQTEAYQKEEANHVLELFKKDMGSYRDPINEEKMTDSDTSLSPEMVIDDDQSYPREDESIDDLHHITSDMLML